MPYIKRISYRPQPDELSIAEAEYVLQHFEVAANSVIVNRQQEVFWRAIDEVEVAKSARVSGPAGWWVRLFLHSNEDRYHVGIYFGNEEAILTNISEQVMIYVLKMIAYYAPGQVLYTGPTGIIPLET